VVVRAITLYQKACDGGAMKGCFDLGYVYGEGIGVTKDTTKATALYQRACNGGVAIACSMARHP
jgi:uncharacterized protein